MPHPGPGMEIALDQFTPLLHIWIHLGSHTAWGMRKAVGRTADSDMWGAESEAGLRKQCARDV